MPYTVALNRMSLRYSEFGRYNVNLSVVTECVYTIWSHRHDNRLQYYRTCLRKCTFLSFLRYQRNVVIVICTYIDLFQRTYKYLIRHILSGALLFVQSLFLSLYVVFIFCSVTLCHIFFFLTCVTVENAIISFANLCCNSLAVIFSVS